MTNSCELALYAYILENHNPKQELFFKFNFAFKNKFNSYLKSLGKNEYSNSAIKNGMSSLVKNGFIQNHTRSFYYVNTKFGK
jgi:hypothetical protein